MKKELSFEEALKELEEIVVNLEKGDISLDDAIKAYENCLLYTSPSPRDMSASRMPSSA